MLKLIQEKSLPEKKKEETKTSEPKNKKKAKNSGKILKGEFGKEVEVLVNFPKNFPASSPSFSIILNSSSNPTLFPL